MVGLWKRIRKRWRLQGLLTLGGKGWWEDHVLCRESSRGRLFLLFIERLSIQATILMGWEALSIGFRLLWLVACLVPRRRSATLPSTKLFIHVLGIIVYKTLSFMATL